MNWKHAVVAVAAMGPVIALLGFGMTRDPHEIPSPLPGRVAPAFALSALARDVPAGPVSSAPVALEDLRGKVVVLNFWASWCLPCAEEHRALSAAALEYADRGVQFFGVLYKDTPESALPWLDRMGGQSYPTLLDPTSRTAIDYGLYGVPETFFIGPDGRVIYKHTGPVTRADLVSRLDSILTARSRGGS